MWGVRGSLCRGSVGSPWVEWEAAGGCGHESTALMLQKLGGAAVRLQVVSKQELGTQVTWMHGFTGRGERSPFVPATRSCSF